MGNVVEGSEAKLTCVTTGDKAAVISFHDASDDSALDTDKVTTNSATVDSKVESTGVLTLATVAQSASKEYYCKATWDSDEVKSPNVFLAVLGLRTMDMSKTAPVGQTANFRCKADAFLQK